MTLYEKLGTTEPGRHARSIGSLLYDMGSNVSKHHTDRLSHAQAYLERLAMAEVAAQVEPWARELLAPPKGEETAK